MKPACLAFSLSLLSTVAQAPAQTANNVTVLSRLARPGITGYSGVHGWVDPMSGRELAVVGTYEGSWFVDLTDPRNPVDKGHISGPPATFWREPTVYRQFAYMVTEHAGGMQVFDLRNPDAIQLVNTVTLPGWNNTHTVSIDAVRGMLYVNGTTLGCLVFDVATDPANPRRVATWLTAYVHDAFIHRDVAYFASTISGRLWLVDVSALPAMPLIHSFPTPGGRTHNAWTNDAATLLITTDDVGGAPILTWDITNPRAPVQLGQWTPPINTIIHYAFLTDDKIVHSAELGQAYRVLDVSDPRQPREFASLTGVGAWNVYPFQPSGTVYVTGIPAAEGLWSVRIACGVGERYGRGTAGSGGHVPVIDWNQGIAQVGNAGYRLESRSLLGGTAALLLLGARAAAIPVAGVELAVDPTGPLLVMTTTASGAGPGQGTAGIPLALPNDPALAGATLRAQWLALDPAATAGLSASRGMQFTLCR
jgi:choice-of-anchor B domain-containing protein